ncbi:Hexaprenyldihydroxybenzoate methyltransferase, mitochondrial-like protein [Gossypium australe]|uniref:Hexaprenyldihydroxybenzoate methyltransferase, mitochondrial-like protein n=1 Tax=Gossypium australe TaxID=47621 RepID=A0A5B6WV17_9ROSI|nr:Hexaprenyldihydroxybenzoate methyltransferase, mitochondrial-like protein [Gossypium australe]
MTKLSRQVPVDKDRKHGAEEFRGRTHPSRVEYWLENSQWIFYEITYSLEDYLRCAASLLIDEAYNWWLTLTALKEFLELTQGNKSVAEYEREFVHISKYAREIVPTKEEMCISFENGLNDEIKMMIGGAEI